MVRVVIVALFIRITVVLCFSLAMLALSSCVRAAIPVDGTLIENQAVVNYIDSLSNDISFTSNIATLAVSNSGPPPTATIRFLEPADRSVGSAPVYNDSNTFIDGVTYTLNTYPNYSPIIDGVYLEATSISFNTDAFTQETIVAQLNSLGSGDTVDVSLYETGTNTGVFVSIAPVTLTVAPNVSARAAKIMVAASNNRPGDVCPGSISLPPVYSNTLLAGCQLISQSNDRLQASITDPALGNVVADTAIVDPSGVIFDSVTNQAVAGATVSIVDAITGQLAVDPDNPGSFLAPQVTAADGAYRYPRVAPGDYYMHVIAPDRYTFPSINNDVFAYANREVNDFSFGRQGFAGTADNNGVFTLSAGDPILVIDIPVDPDPIQTIDGVVFTSQNGEPVAGATVSILNVTGGAAAQNRSLSQRVFEPVVTNADGFYQFDDVLPGSYYISVTPPSNYLFPSELDVGDIVGPYAVVPSSYGRDGYLQTDQFSGVFTVALNGQTSTFNMPIDRDLSQTILVVSKTASASEADIGDRIKYTVSVQNVSDETVTDVRVVDTLPYGFKFELGSVTVAGNPVTPMTSQPQLNVAIGTLEPQQNIEVTYVALLTAGAIDSDGINRVLARSGLIVSDEARARVELKQRGLLSDKSIIFGKLFIDEGCDYKQNNDEWPIAGVRLYFEDGTYVVSDENGQYSLYGVSAGHHVIKLDKVTLPENISPYPVETRFAADPYSRFVEVKQGELHRADFVFSCPQPEHAEALLADLKARNLSVNGEWLLDQVSKFNGGVDVNNSYQAAASPQVDGDVSSGALYGREIEHGEEVEYDQAVDIEAIKNHEEFDGDAGSHSALSNTRIPKAKEAAESILKQQAMAGKWVWPEGDVVREGRLMYAVRSDVKPQLFVNGEQIDNSLRGEVALYEAESAQVESWYRLPFEQGYNNVEVKAMDPFGNLRTLLKEKAFYYPGSAVDVEIKPSANRLAADRGRSILPIEVRLIDSGGHPAKGIGFVSIETQFGQWLERDIQPSEPGHQVRVIHGVAKVHLRSSAHVGEVRIRALWHDRAVDEVVDFVEPLRPLIAVGLVELSGHIASLDDQGIKPSEQSDGYSDLFDVDGKTAFFLKGKVKGDMLLTMSYDSDKGSETELFRDIDPNAYYPVYGDASIKGYDAQSRSKLYAKLEKNRHSILWGDFKTDVKPDVQNSLGKLNQSLTGVNARFDNERLRVLGFAAEVDETTQTIELDGNGTATFYQLPNAPIVRHSETIELVTRDRENAGLIIAVQPLVQFSDYNLDPFSGHLRFFEPVLSQDEAGNPIAIRVTYQSENAVDEHTVAGVRASISINDQLSAGVSYGHDSQQSGFDITTAHVQHRIGQRHQITAEVGRMRHEDGVSPGHAGQLQVTSRWGDKINSRLSVAKADENFDYSLAPIANGKQEIKADVDYKLGDRSELAFKGLQSKDTVANSERQSLGVDYKQDVFGWKLTSGVSHINQDNAGDGNSFEAGKLRVDKGFTVFDRGGNVYAEYQQDFSTSDRKSWQLGSEYKLMENMTSYVRHEVIDSFSGITSLSTGAQRSNSMVGIKTDVLDNTNMYSEYRLRGTIDSDELQAVNGVRSQFELATDWTLSPSFEMIDTIEGDNSGDGYSVSLAYVDHRHKNARKSARIETRQGERSDYYAFDGAYIGRLNENWSSIYLDNYYLESADNSKDRQSNVLTLGAAFRPRTHNSLNSLYFYQWKEEDNIAEEERSAHIFSMHHNYLFDYGLTLSGKFALKSQTQTIDDTAYTAQAFLLGGRLIQGISRRWDMDYRVAILSSDLQVDTRYSFGIGVNYLVAKNLRVGIGFNIVGFEDKDLDAQSYHAQGVNFGLQYKFDEALFKWLQ